MRKRRRSRAWSKRVWAAAVCAIALPSIAWAEPPVFAKPPPPRFAQRHPELTRQDVDNTSAKEKKENERRFLAHWEQGITALDAGDFKLCEEHFARAWVLFQTPGASANLGKCENALGYHVDAAEHLRQALVTYESAGKDPNAVMDFRMKTTDELERATRQLGVFRVENAPLGATLSFGPDLTYTASSDWIYLYPGDYTLEVRAAEGVLHTARIHVAKGQVYTHRIPYAKVGDVLPTAPVLPADPRPSLALVVVGSASAAALAAVGVGFVVAAHERFGEAERLRAQIGGIFGGTSGACHSPTGERVDLCRKLDGVTDDRAMFFYAASTSLVAGGVIGLATGAYGLWPRPKPAAAAPAKPAGLHITGAGLVASPSAAGVTLGGVW